MKDRAETFDDLRYGIRRRILELMSHEQAEEWIRYPMPFLKGKTLLALYNEEDGYAKVSKFLTDNGGHLR